jgi:hypothetical protein
MDTPDEEKPEYPKAFLILLVTIVVALVSAAVLLFCWNAYQDFATDAQVLDPCQAYRSLVLTTLDPEQDSFCAKH